METDSIYLRARYYSPKLGRFTTEDPIRSGGNWYSYCGGNPVFYIDNSGLKSVEARAYVEENGGEVIWCSETKTAIFKNGEKGFAVASTENNTVNGVMRLDDSIINTELGFGLNSTAHSSNTTYFGTVVYSKIGHTQPDSGLAGLSDEEISKRARDKSLSGKERDRYKREEKIRDLRNKQKRQNKYKIDGEPVVVLTPESSDGYLENNIPNDGVKTGDVIGAVTVVAIAAGVIYYIYTGDPSIVYQYAG